jgi:hypothetical protein
VDDKAEFVEALVAPMKAADDALHSGDAGPRKALWSTNEPVSVFGAAMSATGPVEIEATFDWLASRFTGFESAEWEVLSADVSGDLAYVVAIEHTTRFDWGSPDRGLRAAGYDPSAPRGRRVACVPPSRRSGGRKRCCPRPPPRPTGREPAVGGGRAWSRSTC